MSRQPIQHPDKQVDTGAYSAGLVCDGWLYVSGQGPLDMATGQVVAGSIEQQTRRTLENLRKVLEAAGCGFDDVVKTTVYLADIADFAAFNAVYAECFAGVRPARSTVQATPPFDMRVEIDAVARVPGAG